MSHLLMEVIEHKIKKNSIHLFNEEGKKVIKVFSSSNFFLNTVLKSEIKIFS